MNKYGGHKQFHDGLSSINEHSYPVCENPPTGEHTDVAGPVAMNAYH
jgi:hypothetical protein